MRPYSYNIVQVITLFLVRCYAFGAIDYIMKHGGVYNTTTAVLSESFTSTRAWVEHRLLLTKKFNTINVKKSETLRIGIFDFNDTGSDCFYSNENNHLDGYSVKLLEEITRIVNLKTVWFVLNFTDNLEDLFNVNQLDVAICAPQPLNKLPDGITMLVPVLKSKYMLVYKHNKVHITKDIFVLTFAGTLWLCFLILLVVLAICLKITTLYGSKIHKSTEYCAWTWVEITLWAIAAACQQGLSYTPSGFASRSIFFLGYLTSYLLYTGFAAAITSVLVRHELHQLQPHELKYPQMRLVCLDHLRYDTASYLCNYNDVTYVESTEYLFHKLNDQNTIGIIPKIYFDNYARTSIPYENRQLYLTTEITNTNYERGFIIKSSNKDIKDVLNKWILRLDQSGVLQRYFEIYFSSSYIQAESYYSSAGIEHVGSALIVFMGGLAFAVFYLIAEFIYAYYTMRKQMHKQRRFNNVDSSSKF